MGVKSQKAEAFRKLFTEYAKGKKEITVSCGFWEQEKGQSYVIG